MARFQKLRRYASKYRKRIYSLYGNGMRGIKKQRRSSSRRSKNPLTAGKKILGLTPLVWLLLGIASYFFIAPFKNFVNGIIKKK